jgi:carbamoyltransferase
VEQQIRQHYLFSRPISFNEHHRSHAASAFYTSPFERALVLTIDGIGEFETAAVHLGQGNELRKLQSIHFPHSLGLLYSVFTQYLGFEVNDGEYKVMGLAPYGRPRYLNLIVGPILRLRDDGSFTLNRGFFTLSNRDRHYHPRLVEHLGIKPRFAGGELLQEHVDLASSIQRALELALRNVLRALIKQHNIKDFCFAGGVALNCTANADLIREFGIRSHVHPAAGDAGGALGAALDAVVRNSSSKHIKRFAFSPYLGVTYSDAATEFTFSANNVPYRRSDNVAAEIAQKPSAGQIV